MTVSTIPAPSIWALASCLLQCLPREGLEHLLEALIAGLDLLDGNPDAEAEEDCCAAGDDDPGLLAHGNLKDWYPGDVDDAEPEPESPEVSRLAALNAG